jgi:predicted enzyme related to lactoylglutathione lyase
MSQFIWYDLMTPDMKASSDFYAHVVGWTIRDSGMPGADYLLLGANGIDVGGIMPLPPGEGMPPMWTGYIYSPDVDRDTARAGTLGGRIYKRRKTFRASAASPCWGTHQVRASSFSNPHPAINPRKCQMARRATSAGVN